MIFMIRPVSLSVIAIQDTPILFFVKRGGNFFIVISEMNGNKDENQTQLVGWISAIERPSFRVPVVVEVPNRRRAVVAVALSS